MKILDRLILISLKRRLKSYKRDAKWYEKKGNMDAFLTKNGEYTDFYHTIGIPELENRIKNYESECE